MKTKVCWFESKLDLEKSCLVLAGSWERIFVPIRWSLGNACSKIGESPLFEQVTIQTSEFKYRSGGIALIFECIGTNF